MKRSDPVPRAPSRLERQAFIANNLIQLKRAQDAARTLGVQPEPVPIQGPNDFDSAVKAVRGTDGLLLLESPLFTTHRARHPVIGRRAFISGMVGAAMPWPRAAYAQKPA